jgi:hypothetical protein
MNWLTVIYVVWFVGGFWLLGALIVLGRRYARQVRGRKRCRQWLCPQCRAAFGTDAEVRSWQRRKGNHIRSELFSGPVMTCHRCGLAYWFTWDGRLLPSELVEAGSLEVAVEKKRPAC